MTKNALGLDWARELENFQEIVHYFSPPPGEIPELRGIDVFGESIPLNGIIGGDHLIYVDFKKRYDLDARIGEAERAGRGAVAGNLTACRSKAAIALADVSGHQLTDALLSLVLHQAFLLGATYELDFYGEITTRLFENLNTRFYQSSAVHKYLTLIYGEISEKGTFRFISAAHPPPIVFSRHFDQIMSISDDFLVTFPPIGTMPSADYIDRKTISSVLGYKGNYEVNEINLMGSGDILLLYTDGFTDHSNGQELYCPLHLERRLREIKDLSAKEIYYAIKEDFLKFAHPCDDVTFVVIKRGER